MRSGFSRSRRELELKRRQDIRKTPAAESARCGYSRASPMSASEKSFPALRQPVFRSYFFGAATAMMADSIEHVISYWIMFEKFRSPALAGFAVISHWVPFILFSLWSGALADRYDPRRIIQIGMGLFMAVSLGWGV